MNHKNSPEENTQPLSYALYYRKCTNPHIKSSEKYNLRYEIVPVIMGENYVVWQGESVERTYDENNEIVKSKEEMLIWFSLVTGNEVKYEISLEHDGWMSNERVEYIGELRK